MKVLILFACIAAASAAPDKRPESDSGLRRIVDYAGPSSSVTFLQGADLSGERTYSAPAPVIRQRVEYAPAPRITYVTRQREPETRYITVQAPAPRPRYTVVQARPQPRYTVVQAPAPRYTVVQREPEPLPAPIEIEAPEPAPVRLEVPAPAPRIRYTTVRQQQSSEEYGDIDARYKFGYQIRDDYTANYQTRDEERDGNRVTGSYVVYDPDGFLRTVTYGDDGNGFYANVKREPSDLFGSRAVVRDSSEEQRYAQPQ